MESEEWSAVDVRFAAVLDELEIARPLDVEDLCRAVAERRGRPLHLLPLPESAGADAGLCGLWLGLADSDVVFYEPGTSPVHRTHIILHELAHILLDHGKLADGESAVLAGLFPSLDPALVSSMLARGRTSYSAVEEQEAELLATLISSHGRSTPVARRTASSREAGVLGRLGDALARGRGRGR
ncbi:hypothetical protein ACFXA3_26120 [Streptomyces sp. NPDC059456]|uniref:hypothetical protein n=1 Tax=Streptomyces sp. NPDC059456 TaxID=3346838 RepID=UPI0036895A1B